MIVIAFTTALALYSVLLLIGAISIWLYTELRARRTLWVLEKQHLWRCVFCGYTYLEEDEQPISQCPRCNSLNSEKDRLARFVHSRHPQTEPIQSAMDEEMPRRNPSRRKNPGARKKGPRRRR